MTTFATPQTGASLLLALSANGASPSKYNTVVVLSPTRISALRAFAALEAGYSVVVGASSSDIWDNELAWRRDQGQVSILDWDLPSDANEDAWTAWFDSMPRELARACMLMVLGDTMPPNPSSSRTRRTFASAQAFATVASERRFLVNVADAPTLSDFSWPVTHRFQLRGDGASTPLARDATKSPLQLALTTNSSACRLATRIRREIVAALPSNIGDAVRSISLVRAQLQAQAPSSQAWDKTEADSDEVELAGSAFNRPVEQLTRERSAQLERELLVTSVNARRDESVESIGTSSSDVSTAASSVAAVSSWSAAEAQRTRMRYVAQLSEYWPLDRLASVTLSTLLSPSTPLPSSGTHSPVFDTPPSQHSLLLAPPVNTQGRIFLLGTGTGSTLLLTRLAYLFLTSPPGSPYYVDLFLSDKLVPAEILALIPEERRKGVVIAKKYPGNAEHAQDELMRLAVEGAREGKTVLRMKQGDPFLYGRGGEEVLHFRQAGFDPVVIPGLSSCLAGPTICGIPVTQRGVAETLSVCTGVGRGGRVVGIDGYERGKTLTVLMGVARLDALVESLVAHPKSPFPPYLPMALIERASSPDQRVVSATIETMSDILKRLSPHRPPGMLVIGWSVMCLEGTDGRGDMGILDDQGEGSEDRDRKRVQDWLGPEGYRLKEGLGDEWRKIAQGAEW